MYASPAESAEPEYGNGQGGQRGRFEYFRQHHGHIAESNPVLSNIAPQTTPIGAFALTINGANFVQGAQVMFAGSPLNTTFLSSAQLTAAGTASSAGTFCDHGHESKPGKRQL